MNVQRCITIVFAAHIYNIPLLQIVLTTVLIKSYPVK